MQRIGKLDQPITIQELTITSDGMGADVEAYTTLANSPKWAEYIPVRGIERTMYGDKVESRIEFRLRMRRDPRVTSTCRVLHKTKIYRVVGNPEDYQREDDMVLRCQEVV